ncbi:MAG: starch-binding protein [Ruminococcus sp.]|nr:starch-binding protein [Ruminococcus sp.]
MARRMRRLMSLLICLLMVMSVATVATVATASAASGDTVYCENAAGWGEVYCYMWKDGSGDNQSWPGVKMTKGDGNLWSYSVTGDWNMVIFNSGNGGTQTGDMSYPGNGGCFNNSSNSWSTIDVPTNPTTPTTPTTPTPSGKNVVYCKNEAGWGKVNVYMWTDGQGDNGGWPGVTAQSIGDNVWMLEYDKAYAKIIFNDGGGTQTGDLTHPGTGQMYNNATGKWEIYDPSQLHIKGFTTDGETTQYTTVDIRLTLEAGGGEGELLYKFTAGNTVISDFSTDSTVVWTPTTAGSYTVTATVKDSAGNTKSETLAFTIKDINSEVKPVIMSVNFGASETQVKKGEQATIDITAGGGNVGTKLLFYKVVITDPSGNTSNVPYYTTKNAYKFTPAALGTYSVDVFVQGSDNATVTKNYKIESVSEFTPDADLKASASVTGDTTVGSTVTIKASATGGKAPYTYQFSVNGQVVKAYSSTASYALSLTSAGTYTVEVAVKDANGTVAKKNVTVTATATDVPVNPGEGKKGDADCSGNVNVKDATEVQKHVAGIVTLSAQGAKNADVDNSTSINVKDATNIQKFVAGIITW